eukprot:scaffold75701_cov75-Phaeocystis_antarctica.AAC.2
MVFASHSKRAAASFKCSHLELLQLGRERGYSACCPVAETVVVLTWPSSSAASAATPPAVR